MYVANGIRRAFGAARLQPVFHTSILMFELLSYNALLLHLLCRLL